MTAKCILWMTAGFSSFICFRPVKTAVDIFMFITVAPRFVTQHALALNAWKNLNNKSSFSLEFMRKSLGANNSRKYHPSEKFPRSRLCGNKRKKGKCDTFFLRYLRTLGNTFSNKTFRVGFYHGERKMQRAQQGRSFSLVLKFLYTFKTNCKLNSIAGHQNTANFSVTTNPRYEGCPVPKTGGNDSFILSTDYSYLK